ncbi:glycoside hydrolase family 13 protein [Rathayibacter sp. YIM 133350]|uniref:glycoside hydrolase family 13 protein n=1 Tax=Rathayibacter sp. YIM 133350 TaxID=3131992 RepID=UPI00307E062B
MTTDVVETQTVATAVATDEASWWRQAVVYQVYPRSFADADGDGIGDLRGALSRVPYLRDLGVDAIWLSPFYPSALADGGYDVDDYRDVDPRLGTLDDLDALVAALHEAGMRIIVDIVPNHTSNRHDWFRQALAAPKGSRERDRYIFRPGLGANGELPPADWTSAFGGPAWQSVGDGDWYMHYFAVEQPDLNWDNREVRDDFLETLRFWSDRGVDGFRIDVAHGLAKYLPEQLPDQATLDSLPRNGGHPLWDRDEVHEIYADWRRLFNSYAPPRTAVAEAWVDSSRRPRYASPDGLGQAFNFDLLEADFDAARFRQVVEQNLALARDSGSSSTWVLSNHDVVRHATRYGLPEPERADEKHGARWLLSGGTEPRLDAGRGLRRARAATLFMLGLPGSAYLYQGEELGLHEVADIPAERRQDPAFFRNPGIQVGRDGSRVPLPWSRSGPSLGFGEAEPHLPQPQWFADLSVQAQEDDPNSTLSMYRQALALRRRLQTDETLEWLPAPADVVHFTRSNGWQVVMNFGTRPVPMPSGEVLLSSGPIDGDELPGETAVWLRAISSD